MSQFNPSNKHATQGIVDALVSLAQVVFREVNNHTPIKLDKAPVKRYFKTDNPTDVSRIVSSMAFILTGLGIHGRRVVSKHKALHNNSTMALAGNVSKHWSMVFNLPEPCTENPIHRCVVLHCLDGKCAADVGLYSTPTVASFKMDDSTRKSLTSEQIHAVYKEYLLKGTFFLTYFPEKADSGKNEHSMVTVLKHLDIESLHSIVNELNIECNSNKTNHPLGGRFTLTTYPNSDNPIIGNAWELVNWVPGYCIQRFVMDIMDGDVTSDKLLNRRGNNLRRLGKLYLKGTTATE